MRKDNRSFFEKLTGVSTQDYEEEEEDQGYTEIETHHDRKRERINNTYQDPYQEEEGELSIDLYETRDNIVIKTVVAGVNPEDLDISIARDRVKVSGNRVPEKDTVDTEYHYQEIYWGAFSREVELPKEIEIDESEAIARHGFLTIKLPKIKKDRQTRLRVKSH